jgi:BON domain
MVFSDTPPFQPAGEQRREDEDATAALPALSPEDLRLAERVERALSETGHGALRTVSVSVNAGIVILGGRVASYYLKQVAQTAVLAVPGAHQIRNSVDVVRPNSSH